MDAVNNILAPFVKLIEQVFLYSYQITGNYGFSIVLLSLVVSVLLLPVFVLIEKAKKKDDAVKQKMKPFVDEIKRCYKGQERFYYLKTLNRQFAHNPIRSLIPILSLLLQIPFFIAAYQYLESFEPLAEESFLFIKDLSIPDALFGAINVLPIAMTVINLITAWFYTRHGNTSERRQMLIVAGVFLVLLFNLPSGLVLYWTMNNVFSFFRLFITNREVFKAHKRQVTPKNNWLGWYKAQMQISSQLIKGLFSFISVVGCLGQLYWAYYYNFDDIILRLILAVAISAIVSFVIVTFIVLAKHYVRQLKLLTIKPALFYSLSFLSTYFFIASKYYYEKQNTTLIYISLLFLVPTQLIGVLYYLKAKQRVKPFIFNATTVLLITIAAVQVLNVIVVVTGEDFVFSFKNIGLSVSNDSLINVVLWGVLFIVPAVITHSLSEKPEVKKNLKTGWLLYVLSSFYILGFIYLWNPLIVYSSFPESFNFFAVDILKNNVTMFVKLFCSSVIIYLVLPRKQKYFANVAILTFVVLSFLHNSIWPIDLGALHEGEFENPENLSIPIVQFFVEAGLIIGIVAVVRFLINRNYQKQIVVGLIAITLVLVTQSFYQAGRSGNFRNNPDKVFDGESSISFSKTEPNVIFIIPDAFQGGSIGKMLQEEKELMNQYDGFVWYPNTVAISRVTNTSIAPLIGGHAYTPDILHENKTHTNREKISAVKEEFAKKARDRNFLFTSTSLPYTNIDEENYDTFIPAWHKDWDRFYSDLGIEVAMESDYTLLSNNALLFSAPLVFKPKIYNDGDWFNLYNASTTKITSEYMKYHFFRLLPKISNTQSEKGNFIMLYSQVTHHPWHRVNNDGAITRNVSPYQNNLWLMKTLRYWIKWMKDNGVYDNTKIVIVSDHGAHWKKWKGEVDVDIPFKNIDEDVIKLQHLLNFNPVLLVKDFNATGEISKDWRLLSNIDASSIAFDENDPTKIDSADYPQRHLQAFTSWWSKDMADKNDFYLVDEYEVTKSIFDGDNWKHKKHY